MRRNRMCLGNAGRQTDAMSGRMESFEPAGAWRKIRKATGKKLVALSLVAVLAVGGTVSASAEDFIGEAGWLAEFNSAGTDIECNFDKNNIADEMSEIQPGDSMTVSVTIKNSWSGETDWYMENTVIKSLEDANKENSEGASYEYVLTYNGETLYSNENLGGENSSDDSTGLEEANTNDALEDYFYVDRLATGESGTVTLKVKVEGETGVNGYQDTLAQIRMNFAVEKVSLKDGGTITRNIVKTVKTGDTSKIMLYCSVALAAGIVLVIVAFRTNRSRRRDRVKGE